MNRRVFLLTAMFFTSQFMTPAMGADDAPANAKQVNPSGTWRLEYDFAQTRFKDAFRIHVEDDGSIVGTLKRNETTHELKEEKLDGDKLSFTVSGEYEGTPWVTKFSGKISKDEMDGTAIVEFNGESYEFPWTPKRSVQLEDTVGKWKIRIETPNGDVLEPTLQISGEGEKYKGVYVGAQDQEMDVSDLRVEDNHLLFSVSREFNGNKMKVDYKGRPYGDKINGTLEYDLAGNTGEVEFAAKRDRPKKEKESNESAEK